MKYTDEQLKNLPKEQLFKIFTSLPKGSLDRQKVFRYYTAANVGQTFGSEAKEKVLKQITPTGKKTRVPARTEYGEIMHGIRRIACTYRGDGKGFTECLFKGITDTYSVKNISILGLKSKNVIKYAIDPKGLIMDIEPTNMNAYGNAVVDEEVMRHVYETKDLGYLQTVRQAISTVRSGDLVKLRDFSWAPRKIPEKLKRLF